MEEVYICRDSWTAQIRLNLFSKSDFTRTGFSGAIASAGDCIGYLIARWGWTK
jgi:hypothetical protein